MPRRPGSACCRRWAGAAPSRSASSCGRSTPAGAPRWRTSGRLSGWSSPVSCTTSWPTTSRASSWPPRPRPWWPDLPRRRRPRALRDRARRHRRAHRDAPDGRRPARAGRRGRPHPGRGAGRGAHVGAPVRSRVPPGAAHHRPRAGARRAAARGRRDRLPGGAGSSHQRPQARAARRDRRRGRPDPRGGPAGVGAQRRRPPGPGERRVGGGFGLVGMGERVAALDGTLTAGPIAPGVWSVTVRLPLRGTR